MGGAKGGLFGHWRVGSQVGSRSGGSGPRAQRNDEPVTVVESFDFASVFAPCSHSDSIFLFRLPPTRTDGAIRWRLSAAKDVIPPDLDPFGSSDDLYAAASQDEPALPR